MPTIDLVLAGVTLEIETQSLRLIDLFTDYFGYYSPRVRQADDRPAESREKCGIRLRLICVEQLAGVDSYLPAGARRISQTGVLGFWSFDGEGGAGYCFHTEVAAFRVDLQSGEIVGHVAPRALDYPHILANTYAMFPLLLLLRERGIYHLHAAAVVSPRGKVWLISGAQRAGKTTLTTALGLAGWRPISDDSLLVKGGSGGDGERGIEILALRKYFHLGDQLLERWSGLRGMVRHHQYLDRTCVGALDFFGTRELAELPWRRVDHLLLPMISHGERSRLVLRPPSEGLMMLGEQSVYLQLWGERTKEQWHLLGQIARGATTFRLESGLDLLEEPRLVASILAEVEGQGSSGNGQEVEG